MSEMSIRELNSNISKVVSRVEAGETINIKRNGKVVVRMIPARPVRDAAWYKAWREMNVVLDKGFPINAGRITEDEKYGDAQL